MLKRSSEDRTIMQVAKLLEECARVCCGYLDHLELGNVDLLNTSTLACINMVRASRCINTTGKLLRLISFIFGLFQLNRQISFP